MKTINVYSFSELSEEVQEKVIYNHYNNEDYAFLTEDIKEELKQIDKYFNDIELQYSLSYSQGSGLSFSGDFDLHKWIEDNYKHIKTSVFDALCNYVYKVHSTGNAGRYCCCQKNQIKFEYSYNNREFPRIENLWQSILEDIQNIIGELKG